MNLNINRIIGVIINTTLVFSGFSLSNLKIHELSKTSINNKSELFAGEIKSISTIKNASSRTTIKLLKQKLNSQWTPCHDNVLLQIKSASKIDLKTGDLIIFNGRIRTVPIPKNPAQFDYKSYLFYKEIKHQAFLHSDKIKVLKTEPNLFTYLDELRTKLLSLLERNLNVNEYGIASALLLGQKDGITSTLKANYSRVGVMHILAVSGLHVGLIYLILSNLLGWMPKSKNHQNVKICLIIMGLWLYASLTGLSSSVIRAATMFSFILFAKILNRNSNIFNTIAASAFVLLIFNPFLIYDVGFQLSYTAVLGIVIMQPFIYGLFSYSNVVISKAWQLCSVSIAAQIATLPLSLYYFHQFPSYFLLSNLIIIPVAILILYVGMASLALSLIPIISNYLFRILGKIIELLNAIVNIFNELPFSNISHIRFGEIDVLIAYSIIIFSICTIYYRTYKFLFTTCICFCIFLLANNYHLYSSLDQKRFIVYHTTAGRILNFVDGKTSYIVSNLDDKTTAYIAENHLISIGSKSKEITLKMLYYKNQNLLITPTLIQFYSQKIGVLTNRLDEVTNQKPIRLKYLVWSNNVQSDLELALKHFQFEYLIIDATNSKYTIENLITAANLRGIKYWNVKEMGAFQVNL